MKPIKLFYQARCPFCKRAFNYIDELKKRPEYKDIVIETIEETEHPDIADQYDYYYVPTFYIADEKVHEGGSYFQKGFGTRVTKNFCTRYRGA